MAEKREKGRPRKSDRINKLNAKAIKESGEKKLGRPHTRSKVNPEIVYNLAKLGCSQQEIGDIIGCTHATVSNQFNDVYTKGKAEQKRTIREYQMRLVEEKNPTMLIWLGKCVLEQKEPAQDHRIDKEIKVTISDYTKGK